MNLVEIWRNNTTKQWHHRFMHSNGRELSRQSEGVTKRSQAIKSAVTSYGLGNLVQNTDREWLSSTRPDVHVFIQVTR